MIALLTRLIRRVTKSAAPLQFYNTLTRQVEKFTLPAFASKVRMYNCGPTVYDRQHIGNLSAAVFADTIRRVLEANGYAVAQVINITDFGHLSGDNEGDADVGEDRMTKGLRKAGLQLTMENMREFATHNMQLYLQDIAALGVAVERIEFPRASDYIPAQIAMIKTLMEKGYAYETSDGVYFDTKLFPHYGALGGIDLSNLQEGARVAINSEKRNPTDFAVWKKDETLGWDAPWGGKGFPGWHIECSGMISEILGKQIDIHTGGVEHIAIHHNNEIAQSEAATGKSPFSRFWMHREHIRMNDAKLAKSTGNVAYLSDLQEHGIHPLALRYWFLTSHYRTPTNFTWESVKGSQQALTKLYTMMQSVRSASSKNVGSDAFAAEFLSRINNDLDTPAAIAYLWQYLKKATPSQRKSALLYADSMLGLGLTATDNSVRKQLHVGDAVVVNSLPMNIQSLIQERAEARKNKAWAKADELRDALKAQGYAVKDTASGQEITRV